MCCVMCRSQCVFFYMSWCVLSCVGHGVLSSVVCCVMCMSWCVVSCVGHDVLYVVHSPNCYIY